MDRALVAIGVLALVALAATLLRARRTRPLERVDPVELGLTAREGVALVAFSAPMCLPCREWEEALGEAGVELTTVDLARRPELARRYGVTETPLVLAVELPGGGVLDSRRNGPRPEAVERLATLATG